MGVTRVKRRSFAGAVCLQEVYSVSDRAASIKTAEPRIRFKDEEEREKHKLEISRRTHAMNFAANFSPTSIYSTLTFDDEHEVHTFREARRIRDNYVRRLMRKYPSAVIFIYMGRGKNTSRIHFHMVSEGILEEDIVGKWDQGEIVHIRNLREHNYYKGVDHGRDYPRLQVIDGGSATGEIDPITGMLKEGYAVLDRDKEDNPTLEAYFVAGRTDYYKGSKLIRTDLNSAPYPLLVPIIHRPDAKRPFGRSRISRSCMSLMQGALRTLLRSEVSAEFYSFPQKYVSGLSQDAEEMDKWQATISSFLRFDKDDDGEKPTLGQFTQQSMSPYTEQLRTFAALFAGETGLTLDDLGFVTDNPSSAEAIKASHENLRLAARKAQKTFGSGFLNVGYLAACVRDNYPYKREQLYLTRPIWDPVFEPDAAMLASIGDGVGKINGAVPGYIGKNAMQDLTGIRPE